MKVSARTRWRLRRFRPLLRKPLVIMRHRGLEPNDVVLAEYPKSGSTWLAFMVIEAALGREVDFESSELIAPAVGKHAQAPRFLPDRGRLLRSHEPYRREYRRAVYVVRHVSDVAVSYYNWLIWLNVSPMPFKPFLEEFLVGRVDGYGSWTDHVQSWMGSHRPSLLVVRYEDLRAETETWLQRVLEFLRVSAPAGAIRRAIESNTIEGMRAKQDRARQTVFKDRSARASFVRRGVAGDSNSWLDAEDLALVARHAGPTLQRLGYALRPDQPTAPPDASSEGESRRRG